VAPVEDENNAPHRDPLPQGEREKRNKASPTKGRGKIGPPLEKGVRGI